MGWKVSGEERVKRFRVYQELEEKYAGALAELQHAKEEVRRKDMTIRHLAAELASLAAADIVNTESANDGQWPERSQPAPASEPSGPGLAKATRPPPRISGKLSVNEILSSLEEQVSKKKGA